MELPEQECGCCKVLHLRKQRILFSFLNVLLTLLESKDKSHVDEEKRNIYVNISLSVCVCVLDFACVWLAAN